jgi:hypothetical protein
MKQPHHLTDLDQPASNENLVRLLVTRDLRQRHPLPIVVSSTQAVIEPHDGASP